MSRRKPAKQVAEPPNVFPVEAAAGQTREQLISIVTAQGILASASTVRTFSMALTGEGDTLELVNQLKTSISRSQGGDTSIADTYLIPQVAALNAVFNEFMRRAALNMGQHPEAMERYARLAMKAQSQCRSTLETLAKIKNPPNVAFVRQANIAHGPQQVNNGVTAGVVAPEGARTEKSESAPIELLESGNGEWLDPRATSTAGRGDPAMEAVGRIDGAKVD